MKSATKKIQRNFRISADLNGELRRQSEVTRINETRLVEDALRYYFRERLKQQLSDTIAAITKGAKSNFNYPVAPYAVTVG